jgi:hypothetical protein
MSLLFPAGTKPEPGTEAYSAWGTQVLAIEIAVLEPELPNISSQFDICQIPTAEIKQKNYRKQQTQLQLQAQIQKAEAETTKQNLSAKQRLLNVTAMFCQRRNFHYCLT